MPCRPAPSKSSRGTVEVDETAIGGNERNKHKKLNMGRGNVGKAVVQAFLERGDTATKKASRARTTIVTDVGGPTMKGNVRAHVEQGSNLFTDGARQYVGLNADYVHEFVDHQVEYVKGTVHTNSLENYFSLLKRALRGTYVSVEPYHLVRYCD